MHPALENLHNTKKLIKKILKKNEPHLTKNILEFLLCKKCKYYLDNDCDCSTYVAFDNLLLS